MPFAGLMNDTIFIVKSDGKKHGPYKAAVTGGKIFPYKVDIVIDAGDKILRHMSNGAEETYIVIDPCFYEAFGGIEAHYQLKVEKGGIIEQPASSTTINHIHMRGHNNKLNLNSTDNSINITFNEAIQNKIESLLGEINKLQDKNLNKYELKEIVEAIREEVLSDKPNKTVIKTLLNSLPPIASILSIGSSLMAMLK